MISRRSWLSFLVAGLAALGVWSMSAHAADDDGWQTIFDGKTLDGWDGNPDFWSVQDGTITGQTTEEKKTKGNTFIIWRKGETADFELKLEYKIIGGNSGIQYRSFEVPNEKWVIGGYQADFEAGDTFSGINYGEKFRNAILAGRGQKTLLKTVDGKFKIETVGTIGDSKEIQTKIKKEDWNEYHISAKGFTFTHNINGVVTSICTDEADDRRAKGVLALQLHAGPAMKVQFRNIKIKHTKPEGSARLDRSSSIPALQAAIVASSFGQTGTAKKKALLLAGNPSHGFGAHDHLSGCSLLAKLLNESGLVDAKVHSLQTKGWPKPEELAEANTIVIYSDGGDRHPFNTHLEELTSLTKKGVGIVCIDRKSVV